VPPETGEAPEGGESESEQPPAPLPEGWDQHQDVQTKVREADSAGYNRAKSHLQRAHQATVSELEDTHKLELQRAGERATAAAVVSTFADTLQELDLTDPTVTNNLRKLLASNDSWARIFSGSQERDAQATLVNLVTSNPKLTADLPEETADEFNATVRELSLKLRSQVAAAETREEVTKAYTTAFATYLEERDKVRDKAIVGAALAKEQKRLEAAARKAAGLTERAENRQNGSPPARPPGGGGSSRSVEEELKDPRTPVSRLLELRGQK
jgi:hypothetical protein